MEYLIIDPSTRKITIPKSEQLFGVYGEGNIERKYFKCPKIVGDNVDLSDCYIFVNYYTAKGLPWEYVKTANDDGKGTGGRKYERVETNSKKNNIGRNEPY